jgi:hypothetical protein
MCHIRDCVYVLKTRVYAQALTMGKTTQNSFHHHRQAFLCSLPLPILCTPPRKRKGITAWQKWEIGFDLCKNELRHIPFQGQVQLHCPEKCLWCVEWRQVISRRQDVFSRDYVFWRRSPDTEAFAKPVMSHRWYDKFNSQRQFERVFYIH